MKRIALMVGGLLVAALAIPMAASAAVDGEGTTYTACVKDKPNNGGVYALQEGDEPRYPCNPGDDEITLGSGDITAVLAGVGLVGGGDSGEVGLAIADGYQLPQGCATGDVAEQTAGGTWTCAPDTDTTYSAGTGLDLTGTTFSIEDGYRLPQACANDEFVQQTASGWACATPTSDDVIGGLAGSHDFGSWGANGSGECPDHSAFTASTLHETELPPFTQPAGTYQTVTDDLEWRIFQDVDVDEADTYYFGYLQILIRDADDDSIVSRWARAENGNSGNDTVTNEDFGVWTSDGGEYYVEIAASAGPCSEANMSGGFSLIRVA